MTKNEARLLRDLRRHGYSYVKLVQERQLALLRAITPPRKDT